MYRIVANLTENFGPVRQPWLHVMLTTSAFDEQYHQMTGLYDNAENSVMWVKNFK